MAHCEPGTRSTSVCAPADLAGLDVAFDYAAVGLALTDADDRIIRANPEFVRISGYTKCELAGLSLADLARSGDSGTWTRKNGESVRVRTTHVPAAEGRAGVLTVEDVTAWQSEYDMLRRKEEVYRAAAEHSSDAIFEWDTKTDRVVVYGAARIGLKEGEIPATFAEWCHRVHPADLEPLFHAIGKHYETREPAKVRHRIARDDGSESLIEVRGSAFRNTSPDSPLWIGLATDITEKQRSEEALSQLAAIVQSCDDAIIACDLEYRIVSWNKGAEKLYGYAAEEVMGRPLSLFAPERPDQAVAETSTHDGEHTVRRMESIHFTRSGSCPVSVSISPVLRKDGALSGYSLISHDIGERKRAERKLVHQALHDALTGLPNRRLMRENLEHAIAGAGEHGRSVGVFFIDIDGFKTINDTMGHVVGDQLLRSVAARLNSCARKADMLSRVGGDEFVLTVSGLHSRHSARLVAAKLIESLSSPFVVNGNEVTIAASIGVSMYPEDSEDPDSLLRNADAAMYQAKHGGKNQVHFFSRALSDALRERMEIASGLRVALDRHEFELHFQPVFGAAGHKILRFEALLRWKRAGGDISPVRFIPIAEETGWIVPIGKWVLQEACKRAAAWQNGPHHGIGVSVNVSAVQMARADFVGMLAQVLADTGLPPGLLELELTESIFINNPRETARTISRIHTLGVTMALDDFGTGYSSLGYLKNLPMDALKIDKSFLGGVGTDPAAIVLVESLVSLAHSLGMRVVVEGVETSEQYKLLHALGCDELQGFLLGKPLPDPFSHSLTYPVASSHSDFHSPAEGLAFVI